MRVKGKSELQQYFIGQVSIFKTSVLPRKIDSLDDDALLDHSWTRLHDDVSVSVTTHTTAICLTSKRCSPWRNKISEASNPKLSLSSNKMPPHPTRPEKPSLFLSEFHRTETKGNKENPITVSMSTANYSHLLTSITQLNSKQRQNTWLKNLRNLRPASQ